MQMLSQTNKQTKQMLQTKQKQPNKQTLAAYILESGLIVEEEMVNSRETPPVLLWPNAA